MREHGSLLLYVHGNRKVRQDGQLRTATSTLTQLLNYDPSTGTVRADLLHVYQNRRDKSRVFIVQELCESRGGRPVLSILTSLMVSVDVKLY